jgi:hypothetical protein
MKASPLFLVLLTCAASAPGSIDFSPVTGERVLDGIKFQQLIFRENGNRITYEQPRGWSYSGNGASIVFTPPGATQAQATIEQSPLRQTQNFDEATMKSLQEQVLTLVSANNQNAELVSAEKNPIMVNRNETFEVTVSYQSAGTEYQRSVLFLNLPDTQLRFRVTARKQDFEKLHKAFRGSICSWQWN